MWDPVRRRLSGWSLTSSDYSRPKVTTSHRSASQRTVFLRLTQRHSNHRHVLIDVVRILFFAFALTLAGLGFCAFAARHLARSRPAMARSGHVAVLVV